MLHHLPSVRLMSIWPLPHLPALVSLYFCRTENITSKNRTGINLNKFEQTPFPTVEQRTTQQLLAHTLYFWDHQKSSRGESTQVQKLMPLILRSCSVGNHQQQSTVNQVPQSWMKLNRSSPRRTAAAIPLAYKASQVVPTAREIKKRKEKKTVTYLQDFHKRNPSRMPVLN